MTAKMQKKTKKQARRPATAAVVFFVFLKKKLNTKRTSYYSTYAYIGTIQYDSDKRPRDNKALRRTTVRTRRMDT